MADYIRFTIFKNDNISKKPQGIFQTLYDLKNNGQMEEHDIQWFEQVMIWFNKNLNTPTQFSRSHKRHASTSGICWYKSTANEHINKMYDLVSILKYYSIEVNISKSNKPGYIVYDDEYQIVAEPFVETNGRKLKK